jgi:hypothetical protein
MQLHTLQYKLKRETLFLTINYIDRMLSRIVVSRTKLQLVGITAMFVAAKYEVSVFFCFSVFRLTL